MRPSSPTHNCQPGAALVPLDALLRAAALAHPALTGEIGFDNAGLIRAKADNQEILTQLHSYWRDACPEAGAPYWAVRSWTMLVWQPTFLAVAAVHLVGTAAPLSELGQKYAQGVVAGFRMPPVATPSDAVERLIEVSGAELAQVCEIFLNQLNRIARVKPLIAKRLVADSLLSALARLSLLASPPDNQQIQQWAQAWLKAMDLIGYSNLTPIALCNGRLQLTLDRKACCLHYLRQDGELCASCPKQKPEVRVQRLTEEWNAYA
ncbi:siderophore ferric iron reductase [Hahella aquimaris]|uniref:siderophore ferric iron reductase n=1 Tax=Hahella sp. HNIBRBA332 TaxID=3015983 RepID=UPI00273C363E|nr:siderophore ferric iron reductase [Hahella sp. HNIBRBA332]WLQ11848.1 siderophore ferric iron reductase [Hahella sp. HNIBRBA332]